MWSRLKRRKTIYGIYAILLVMFYLIAETHILLNQISYRQDMLEMNGNSIFDLLKATNSNINKLIYPEE